MKLGPILTYKDVNLTVRLIGKRCKFSNALSEIEHGNGSSSILSNVYRHNDYPFAFNLPGGTGCYQFIREVIEDETDKPRYEPYDLSDPKVRERLRGRWIIYTKGDDYTTEEVIIVGFGKQGKDYWKVIIGTGEISATELLENYAFDDGTPCGQRVHAGAGHVEGNASERRIDG